MNAENCEIAVNVVVVISYVDEVTLFFIFLWQELERNMFFSKECM